MGVAGHDHGRLVFFFQGYPGVKMGSKSHIGEGIALFHIFRAEYNYIKLEDCFEMCPPPPTIIVNF